MAKTTSKSMKDKSDKKSLPEGHKAASKKPTKKPSMKMDSARAEKHSKSQNKKIGRCAGKICKMKNCKRSYKAKGYCKAHYKMWRKGAYGKKRYKACSDMGCRKPSVKNHHGFCSEHYENYYVKGMTQVKAPTPKKEEASVAQAS